MLTQAGPIRTAIGLSKKVFGEFFQTEAADHHGVLAERRIVDLDEKRATELARTTEKLVVGVELVLDLGFFDDLLDPHHLLHLIADRVAVLTGDSHFAQLGKKVLNLLHLIVIGSDQKPVVFDVGVDGDDDEWIARAYSSLPVPLSPVIRTVDGVAATRGIWSSTRRIGSDDPMNSVTSTSTAEAARTSERNRQRVAQGYELTKDMSKASADVRESVQETSKSAKRQGELIQSVTNAAEYIQALNTKISVVAINTRIEAEKAGEHGRGQGA